MEEDNPEGLKATAPPKTPRNNKSLLEEMDHSGSCSPTSLIEHQGNK
jgi:hypothetical protein